MADKQAIAIGAIVLAVGLALLSSKSIGATSPEYMRGDSEIPELYTSTDDYGGTEQYELLPIARLY